jgi:type II secretory pathway component PulF
MSITIPGALSRLDEPGHRAELYRAWSAARVAGLADSVALEQIGPNRSPEVEELRRHLVVGLTQQRSIDGLVKARPKLFSSLESAVLLAGEQTGTLDTSVQLLATYYLTEYKRMLRVRLRMGYPLFVGVIAAFVATLPVLGRNGWRGYMWAIGISLVALWFLGGLVLSILAGMAAAGIIPTRARFLQALLTAIEAGIPAGHAIRIAVESSGDNELVRHLAKFSEREVNTTPMATLFAGCASIPAPLLSQMAVADATGDYLNTIKLYADALPEK